MWCEPGVKAVRVPQVLSDEKHLCPSILQFVKQKSPRTGKDKEPLYLFSSCIHGNQPLY